MQLFDCFLCKKRQEISGKLHSLFSLQTCENDTKKPMRFWRMGNSRAEKSGGSAVKRRYR